MDDKMIIDLYWKRSEQAISETAGKYGGLCFHIAYNILANNEDAEESVNDTYFAAWNRLPPHRPSVLGAFLSKLTRYLSIDKWRSNHAGRRGGGEIDLALDELETVTSGWDAEKACIYKEAVAAFNSFLDTLPETERKVFLRRYFLLDPVKDIAASFGFSESKVKSMLLRTRGKLRARLQKEGYL